MGTLQQIFGSVFDKSSNNGREFDAIIGHDSVKTIFNKAVLSKRPVHILLVGKPGTAKTMFLTEVIRSIKQSYFIVGSNTTKAGLVNQLFERRPKYLLIDELDKMNKSDQTSLLHLMETGIMAETKIRKTRQLKLTSWVFATANSCEKIIDPLLSRFVVLEIPAYTFEEFTKIAVERLTRENVDRQLAAIICEKVWIELGSADVRDVIKVGRLVDHIREISDIVEIMKKHKSAY